MAQVREIQAVMEEASSDNAWPLLAPQLLKICANPEKLTWSVILEDGTDYSELEEIYINVPIAGRMDAKADNDTRPRMWLEGFGRLRVEQEVAYVEGY